MQDLLRLTAIRGVGPIRARYLVDFFGSAEEVLRAEPRMLLKAGNIGQAILDGRNDPNLIAWAEKEMRFIEDHNIQPLIYGQPGYPTRLIECPDAPVHLFKLGDTPLDNPHIISIVGTRKCTQYGRNIVQQFVRELHELVPDVIVVSGLAYGIDIESHRASLKNDVPTVGVVAHGLDRIYPSQHRPEASTMVRQGGAILTEYPSGTSPERCNYLIFNNFSFLSTSFFCKIPSLFIIKIIGQFGHIKKSIVNFCKNFQFFSLFSKNVPIWCPFTLPISL